LLRSDINIEAGMTWRNTSSRTTSWSSPTGVVVGGVTRRWAVQSCQCSRSYSQSQEYETNFHFCIIKMARF
jgi:hypothetical protein